jgi:hypothetical protein
MPEGFDPGEAPTRRGRRDPELQRALLDDEPLADAQDQDDTNSTVYEGLSEGATVISKFTNYRRIGTEEVWSTYGASDHVLPGESADGAFRRLVEHTVQGAYSQTESMVGLIEEDQRERQQENRARRIVPARGSAGE